MDYIMRAFVLAQEQLTKAKEYGQEFVLVIKSNDGSVNYISTAEHADDMLQDALNLHRATRWTK